MNIQSQADKFLQYCNKNGAAGTAKAVTCRLKNVLSEIWKNDGYDELENYFNPLLIHLVVKNVVKFLTVEDCRVCRQICRLWNAEAGAKFRQQTKITFFPESSRKMRDFLLMAVDEESFGDRGSENNRLPPFRAFSFSAQFAGTDFPREMMEDFVSLYGHNVKNLQVFYPNDGVLSGQDFYLFFVQGMPNLEDIHLVNLPLLLTSQCFSNNINGNICEWEKGKRLRIDRSWEVGNGWKGEFVRDLLTLMPKLEDYEVWTWNSTEDKHSAPYLSSLPLCVRQSLRTLRPGDVGEELGAVLSEMDLHLSRLLLPVLNREISTKTLETLLRSQSNTLQEFQVNISSLQDTRFLQFPILPQLTHLHLTVTFPWNNSSVKFYPCLDYATQLPSLRQFKLELAVEIDEEFINFFFGPSTVCSSLEQLDLNFSGFREDAFGLRMSRIFPNLLRLRLNGYGHRIFSSIFCHLEKLRELQLDLVYGFNIDDQLTGIPRDSLSKCTNWDTGKYERKFPSLSSLESLESLVIRQKECQGKFLPQCRCITELTAYFEIAIMKQLKRLRLENLQFSEECLELLRDSLQDCWLDYCDNNDTH